MDLEHCADCGVTVIFESTSDLPDVREYDVCTGCGKHVCPDCSVIVDESPYCKECAPSPGV